MRASIRASVPARSASAVMVAGGMARPGPLRSLQTGGREADLAGRPRRRAGDPRIRPHRAVARRPGRPAGCAATRSDRASRRHARILPAPPGAGRDAADRSPPHRRSRSAPVPAAAPSAAASRPASDARLIVRPAASTLAAALSRAGAPSRSGSVAASFTSSASTVPLALACSVPPNRPIWTPSASSLSIQRRLGRSRCGREGRPHAAADRLPDQRRQVGKPRHRHVQVAGRDHGRRRQLQRTASFQALPRRALDVDRQPVARLPQRHREIDRSVEQIAARRDPAAGMRRQPAGLDPRPSAHRTTCRAPPRCRRCRPSW